MDDLGAALPAEANFLIKRADCRQIPFGRRPAFAWRRDSWAARPKTRFARVPRPRGPTAAWKRIRAVQSPRRANPGASSTLRCSRWIQGTALALTRAVVGCDPKVGRSRLSGRTRGSTCNARWLGYRCGRGIGLCRSLPALRPRARARLVSWVGGADRSRTLTGEPRASYSRSASFWAALQSSLPPWRGRNNPGPS
jgi:hypothetical protein